MMSQAAHVNEVDDVLRFVCHAKRSSIYFIHISCLEHCCSLSNVSRLVTESLRNSSDKACSTAEFTPVG